MAEQFKQHTLRRTKKKTHRGSQTGTIETNHISLILFTRVTQILYLFFSATSFASLTNE